MKDIRQWPLITSQSLLHLRVRWQIMNARKKLKGATMLHLGCGNNILDGWSNIDVARGPSIIRCDLSRALPVAKGTIEFIYSEHFIEHLTRPRGLLFLKMCHEALKPGGILRISTPDLQKLMREYLKGQVDEWQNVSWAPSSPCAMVNEGLRLWGHQYVYDENELRGALETAGFVNIRRMAWRQSDHETLRNLECRPFHEDLILEGAKLAALQRPVHRAQAILASRKERDRSNQ